MTNRRWSGKSAKRLQSIRWRLPLSYAAVVLFTVLILTITLLIALDRYYTERELRYLNDNAHAVAHRMAQMLEDQVPTEAIDLTTIPLSFFTRARVRVLDTSRQVLADSATSEPGKVFVLSLDPPPAALVGVPAADQGGTTGGESITIAGSAAASGSGFRVEVGGPPQDRGDSVPGDRDYRLWASDAPFGYTLTGEDSVRIFKRSDQQVTVPLNASDGTLLGYLELSEGPAFGTEVITSVLNGLILAGLLAIPLSAFIGWQISRSISGPVLTLTHATQQMAAGDLTARVVLERGDELGTLATAFNTMAGQIERTIRALKQFIGDAAHEIKTPLTAMRTNIELAADGLTEGNARSDLALAQHELERLDRLTSSLLMLARLDADTHETGPATLDLAELVRQIHERYASCAEQAGITLESHKADEPVLITGYREQIIRMLDNLMENAVKFTPEDGTITIALDTTSPGIVQLQVRDTGIGIPADDLPKLFSRFHRGSNAAAYAGSGLGLAIVKAIVEEHGGSVTVNSGEEGTCFCVILPVADIQEGN